MSPTSRENWIKIETLSDVRKYVDIEPSGCWNWNRGTTSAGYGLARFRFRRLMAHRVSWCLATGNPYPKPEVIIRHKCDNPTCVNPEHLEEGTQSDNMRDCVDRGRHTQHEAPFCSRGHARSPENLYVLKNPRSGGKIYACKQCQRIRTQKWRASLRAKGLREPAQERVRTTPYHPLKP